MRRAKFPIVYFEIIGADGGRLRSHYSELFDWQFDVAITTRGFDYASGRDDGASRARWTRRRPAPAATSPSMWRSPRSKRP